MSLLVTGSIGIDTVKTPHGVSKNCIGGSAVYFSMAASFFSPVRFVGVVGNDCPFDLAEIFAGRQIDLDGLEIRKGSKTFRWQGSYQGQMSEATTESVKLNVLAEKPPVVPPQFADSNFVFLANTAPALQMQLLEQVRSPQFVVADTMNLWIENELDALKSLLKKVDALIINDGEARLLANNSNVIAASQRILDMGPKVVVVKKGEFGSMLVNSDGSCILLPAYPTSDVKDPTGAGDSFAGAFMGYIAKTKKTDMETLKTAMAYGTVVASFTIEDFSLQGLAATTTSDIEKRFMLLRELTTFGK
jgi:sugar/nucleoside kinase (ribokinase family)